MITENKSFTLSTLLDESICYLAIGGTNANATMTDGDKAPTMLARAGTGGQRADSLVVFDGQGCSTNGVVAYCLQAGRMDDHHMSVVCYEVTK